MHSIKEMLFISFSFWPTLIIGFALGMTVSLLLLINIKSFSSLIYTINYSIIGLIVFGLVLRLISIFYWKKYNFYFISDMKNHLKGA